MPAVSAAAAATAAAQKKLANGTTGKPLLSLFSTLFLLFLFPPILTKNESIPRHSYSPGTSKTLVSKKVFVSVLI